MKSTPIFRKIVFSSGFLAAIPAILTIMFLPPLGLKHTLQVEPVGKPHSVDFYEDLNSDSITENISSGKGIPYYFILVSDNNNRVYDQWNLKDIINTDMSDIFFGNYDQDKYKEIYIFTYRNDSLFLNINEFFDSGGTRLEHKFITKIGIINNEVTSNVYPAGFFDENGDGFKELYFTITTGFGLEPRRAYYYDIRNDALKCSQFTGVICQFPNLVDSNGDSRPELFGFMSASGNYKTKTPYSDKSTWLMIFDDKLNLEFPPVEIPGFTNTLEVNDYTNGKFKGYLLNHNSGSTDPSVYKPGVMLFSGSGILLKYRPLSFYGFSSPASLIIMKNKLSDRIYLVGNELLELNDQLDIINKSKLPLSSSFRCFKQDIDFDGQDDLLIYSEDEEKLLIINNDLRLIADAKIKASFLKIKFSRFISKEGESKLFMSSVDNGYLIKVKNNRYYYLGFFAYPGIYLMFFVFIILIKKINTLQVVEKESLNRRLTALQLQGIKAQLDPHFTFNTLNSVAALIYLEDRQTAYDYMNKFTQLLRSMINDAERIYRSVFEEVEFVTTYLDLEKLRFGDRFNYEIEVGEGVSQKEQVPKLVLQTFAENAVKHGLSSLSEGGFLRITVIRERNYLKLTIEDNGIGREKSAGKSTSTGKGLRLTSEFYSILNHINRKHIKHIIIDLYKITGESAGTRVEVWVPIGLG